MSARTGIEIIIASEDERTIREYLNELWIKREWNSSKEDLNDRIRRVGDSYIVQFHNSNPRYYPPTGDGQNETTSYAHKKYSPLH